MEDLEMAADTTYQPKTYRRAGGDELVVASGGKIIIESGGTLEAESGAVMTLPDIALEVGDLALADAKIIVGNAAGKAAAVTPSGDVTIDNTGATTIGAKKVLASMTAIADGKILIGGVDGAGAEQTLTGDVTVTNAGVTAIGAKKVTAAMTAIADGKVLIGGADGAGAEQTLTGDVTVTNAGVTAIGAGKVTSAMLANGAGVAALLTAGLGGSQTVIKTETGAKTIVAAHETKNRACIVVAVVTEAFTGDTSRTIVTVGEEDTADKCWAATTFPDGLALGTVLVGAFTNLATKAITVTSTAAEGTGTGGVAVTVIAIPTT